MATVTAKDVSDELKGTSRMYVLSMHRSIGRRAWCIVGAIGSAMLLIGRGLLV